MQNKYTKKFKKWCIEKTRINSLENPNYTVREIWWCKLGTNIGVEQDGTGGNFTRPAVILKGFGKDSCLIAPLTTSTKKHYLRIPVGIVDGKQATVNISQIRIIDTKRLYLKIGFLDKKYFNIITKTIKTWF